MYARESPGGSGTTQKATEKSLSLFARRSVRYKPFMNQEVFGPIDSQMKRFSLADDPENDYRFDSSAMDVSEIGIVKKFPRLRPTTPVDEFIRLMLGFCNFDLAALRRRPL